MPDRPFFDVIREIDEDLADINRKEEAMEEPKTLGITPAKQGALQVLQFNPLRTGSYELKAACQEIADYHSPDEDQARRHLALSAALSHFLESVCVNAPPGPERSTAISRAREAKMWASAAIALEGK